MFRLELHLACIVSKVHEERRCKTHISLLVVVHVHEDASYDGAVLEIDDVL